MTSRKRTPAKKSRKKPAAKPVRPKVLPAETPDPAAECSPPAPPSSDEYSSPVPDHPADSSDNSGPNPLPDNGSPIADQQASEPALTPEIGELRPPPHGRGMIRYGSIDGNPGNKGGGRLPLAVRQEIGRMVREHGLPFLERVLSGEEVDVVPIKVKGGQRLELDEKAGKMVKLDGEERIVYASVPIAARTRLQGVAVALSGSEGMVAPEKPGLTKRRVLEVILRHE